jgi:hypothetical protein
MFVVKKLNVVKKGVKSSRTICVFRACLFVCFVCLVGLWLPRCYGFCQTNFQFGWSKCLILLPMQKVFYYPFFEQGSLCWEFWLNSRVLFTGEERKYMSTAGGGGDWGRWGIQLPPQGGGGLMRPGPQITSKSIAAEGMAACSRHVYFGRGNQARR